MHKLDTIHIEIKRASNHFNHPTQNCLDHLKMTVIANSSNVSCLAISSQSIPHISTVCICYILQFCLLVIFYIVTLVYFAMSILFIVVPCAFLRVPMFFAVTYRGTHVHALVSSTCTMIPINLVLSILFVY